MTTQLAIGIDLGGTKIAGGLVGEDGTILARKSIPSEGCTETTIMSGIAKLVDELRAVGPSVCVIGIGAAGLVDARAGVIVTSPNLPIHDLGLASLIEARCGLPVSLDNDANCAAVAEARLGAGRGFASIVCVTVGTGIGGGIVQDGELVRGRHGFAGEIGHMIIALDGPECACGARGCLEALASGRAIGRLARERFEVPEAEGIRSRVRSRDEVTGALVGELASAGDAFARVLVAQVGRVLGVGLASLANLLDPDAFIVAGGAGSALGDLLLGPAIAAYEQGVLGAGKRTVAPVLPASLGADAGIVGAGLVGLDVSPVDRPRRR